MRGHLKPHRYLVALGSNQRHSRHGLPPVVLKAALAQLAELGEVLAVAPIVGSAPVGPSHRRYANTAAVVDSGLAPRDLLAGLQAVEGAFGRKRRGQPWRARVVDLDIILWSGGAFAADDLVLPHPHFRTRSFVLGPARRVAGDWRDPLTGLTIRQLFSRLPR